MPGILPMKVIKVGSSNQARIAQACDRCRSKKIRCDGIRPCCSQCSNVGFECKTSDKLSRRAFPRGYTESLEERVRTLEGEIRELKDLLDEKDEKIDMLSKMHSNRRLSHCSNLAPSPSDIRECPASPDKEDIFRVQASPLLLNVDNNNGYFAGASSGRAFVDTLLRKVQESGRPCSTIAVDDLFSFKKDKHMIPDTKSPSLTVPPRLFSDRCVNIFFQEWAPLFPIVHKPTFLALYENYVSSPEGIVDSHQLAQLHLIFAIASSSSELPDKQYIGACEYQWQQSLDSVLFDNSLATLQLLVLAVLHCASNGDYKRLQLYKAVAVAMSHRLGLHRGQKRFALGALTSETRKKVFWSLYTIDCFSAAMLGLPKLLKDEDAECEYPADIDDEYVTEKGFQPTLPGETSRLSNALALFRASRILSRILDQLYPAAATHDLSLQRLATFDNEINEWSRELPQHLKLTFVQDKPSTNVTGSRSALLSLAYYYIKGLIHKPAVGSALGGKDSSSLIHIAESSKHIIQIVQLLEERNMSFSFCLNRTEILTFCGLSLLYQGIDLKTTSNIAKDGQRLVKVVSGYLKKWGAPCATDFKRLAALSAPSESKSARRTSDNSMPAPQKVKSPSITFSRNESVSTTSSSESEVFRSQQASHRRATLPNIAMNPLGRQSNASQSSLDSIVSESAVNGSAYHPHTSASRGTPTLPKPSDFDFTRKSRTNLDYLSLSNTPAASRPQSPRPSKVSETHTPIFPASTASAQKNGSVSAAEWESLLSALDSGTTNIYDAVYGGPAIPMLSSMPGVADIHKPASIASGSAYGVSPSDWSSEQWEVKGLTMHELDAALNSGQTVGQAHSVLSFSEESLSSGDELFSSTSTSGILNNRPMMPVGGADSFLLDGLDANFGL